MRLVVASGYHDRTFSTPTITESSSSASGLPVCHHHPHHHHHRCLTHPARVWASVCVYVSSGVGEKRKTGSDECVLIANPGVHVSTREKRSTGVFARNFPVGKTEQQHSTGRRSTEPASRLPRSCGNSRSTASTRQINGEQKCCQGGAEF